MTIEQPDPLSPTRLRGASQSHPIYWLGLQWAVTAEGVESRDGTVMIESSQLWEQEDSQGWSRQMAAMPWLDRADFDEAMAYARSLWPRERARRDGWGLMLVDAYIAWCPNSPTHRWNNRRGQVVVGRRRDIERETDRGPAMDRLPQTMRLCAANGLQPRTQAERIALLFIAFNTLVVRDRLDPQVAHRAFLAIDEYRLCMPPERADAQAQAGGREP